MPEFDFEWEILRWTHKDGGSAEGVVRTPSGDEVIIRIGRKIHSEWHWTDPDDQTFEGDGEKGRYIRTRRKAGNLEIRAIPEYQRWVDSDFDREWGFELPDILAGHTGDRIHISGVDCGELDVKGTALEINDYPHDIDPVPPYAGIDVLSSQITPDELDLIWPQIQTGPKTINMVNPKVDKA